MATFKEALTTSLTNFSKSIAKTYLKTANIVDNLLSTDSTLPLSAKQGNVLQTEIDTLNSNKESTDNAIQGSISISLDTKAIYILTAICNNRTNLYVIASDNELYLHKLVENWEAGVSVSGTTLTILGGTLWYYYRITKLN